MSFVTRVRSMIGIVGCGLLVVSLGCSTTGQQQASSAATSLEETRTEIAGVSNALDKAVASLTDLAEKPQSDLRPQYDAYKASVQELEAQAKKVAASAKEMRDRGEEYFKSWEGKLTDINNPELRQISADRRAALSAHYKNVTEGYQKAKAAFLPLFQQLNDVQRILGLDLTDNGLKMASSSAIEAKKSAAIVDKELDGVSAELDALAKTLGGGTASASK
jgi:chromosome segregation ATPase